MTMSWSARQRRISSKPSDLRLATFTSADEFLNSDCVAGTSCLIADVQMPGTNGLQLHRKLVVSGSPHPGNLHYRLPGRAGPQTGTEGWCSLLPEQAVRRGEPAQLDPRCAGDSITAVQTLEFAARGSVPGCSPQCATGFTRSYLALPDLTGTRAESEPSDPAC